jgi:YD repeat-containing protein
MITFSVTPNYDGQNRVDEVVGFTKPQGIRYNADDTLQKIGYANGVITNFTYDAAQRLKDLTVDSSGASIILISIRPIILKRYRMARQPRHSPMTTITNS